VLDSHERDWAKVGNAGIFGDKAISAVRRFEGDAQAGFCYEHVKVASNWAPYIADARVRASFVPKEELPNFVPHNPPATHTLPGAYKEQPRCECLFGNTYRI